MLPNFRVIHLLNIFYSSFNNSNDSSVPLFIRHSEKYWHTPDSPLPISYHNERPSKYLSNGISKNISWPSEGYPYILHFGFNLEGPIRSVLRSPATDSNFLAFVSYWYRTQWCSTEHTLGHLEPRTISGLTSLDHWVSLIPSIWQGNLSVTPDLGPSHFTGQVTSWTFQACHLRLISWG